MMKKKLAAIVCAALIVTMVAPAAAAKQPNIRLLPPNAGKTVSSTSQAAGKDPQIPAEIKQLNSDILALKQQERTIVGQIRDDLIGARDDSNIVSSSDYQDVITALKSVTGHVGKAERIDCRGGLKQARKMAGGPQKAAYTDIVTNLTNKKAELEAALTTLQGALTKANAIAAQINASDSKWADFQAQAKAKKQTIDQQHADIAKAYADCRGVISNIVATAASNRRILEANADKVKSLETQLKTIVGSLKEVKNSGIKDAVKAYQADRKNLDYTGALAQLDAIIGIQQTRINALSQVKTQLQDVLAQLNTIISSGASSSESAA